MWIVAVVLEISCLGFGVFAARRIARSCPDVTVDTVHRRLRAFAPVTIVFFLALAVPFTTELEDRVAQAMPYWFQRWSGATLWALLLFGFAFSSGLAGWLAVLTSHERRRHLVLALVLVNIALVTFSWRFNAPIASALIEVTSSDGVILQTSSQSCAAATLANVASLRGIELTEREAATLVGTSRFGTSCGQLRYGLHTLGIPFADLNRGYPSLDDVPVPAILFVDHPAVGTEGHAVLFMGVTERKYEVWDPLYGKMLWTRATVRKVWHGGGITCEAFLRNA